jgi:hypothetical protein
VSVDNPELTDADFARAIPGAVRRRLCCGEIRCGKDVTALRRFVAMTQEEFARAVGGRRPQGAAVALIRIVARDPRVLRHILPPSSAE